MDKDIEQLLEWSISIGIELNGIHPKALHGRGIGIVATRHLEVTFEFFFSKNPHYQHLTECLRFSYITTQYSFNYQC